MTPTQDEHVRMPIHINLLKEKNSEQEAEIKTFHEAHCEVGDKANVSAQSPTSPRLSISDIAESTKISPPEKKRRIKEQGDVFAKRCVIFCWQVMNMFYLFLTSGSKTTLILFIYTNNAR